MMINGLPAYTNVHGYNLDPTDDVGQVNNADVSALSRNTRGVADNTRLWPQNSTLRISLLSMTAEQEQFTKDNINKWAPHVNLRFEFTHQSDGDIRIKGSDRHTASYSHVGTEANTDVKPKEPTMRIGFRQGLGAYTAEAIQHEFGHALGLRHEHQHPERTLDLNEKAIRQDNPDEKAFRRNYSKLTTNTVTSPYDRKSIMHYPLPQEYLNSGVTTTANNELSEGDKRFISTLYPKPKRPAPFHWARFPFTLG